MKDLYYSRVFDRKKYKDHNELWENIKMFCQSLVRDEYDVVIRYEDAGVYVVEFNHSAPDLHSSVLMWVDSKEAEELRRKRIRAAELRR